MYKKKLYILMLLLHYVKEPLSQENKLLQSQDFLEMLDVRSRLIKICSDQQLSTRSKDMKK